MKPPHEWPKPPPRNPTPPYYAGTLGGYKLDLYRAMVVWKIEHPAHQHAFKKLARAGRSIKPLKQDIQEVIDSLNRWLEMIGEDEKMALEMATADIKMEQSV